MKELKIFLISGFLFLMIFISLIIFNPDLLGFARAEQTALSQNQIHDTYLYQKTQNDFLGRLNYVSNQYVTHFSKEYLFEKGDKNPRLGIHTFGQFYSFEALFLILGFLYLLYLKSKASIILFAWLFLAPLPASLVSGAPDGARSLYLMGSMHLLVGAGIYAFLKLLKNKTTKTSAGLIIIMLFIFSAYFYLDDYYKNYNVKNPTEWQYGMKQVVEYAKQHPEYSTVYMTNIRSQPYIFFLYYLKQPLDKYFQSVQFNYSDTRSFNLVYSFDRYIFDGWDPIESSPDVGKLYILTSSQYDGLRYKTQFKVKEKITYPNGSDNFFIVSVK